MPRVFRPDPSRELIDARYAHHDREIAALRKGRSNPDPLQKLADDIRAHVITQPDPEAIAAATAVEIATARERFPVLTIADSIERFMDLGDN